MHKLIRFYNQNRKKILRIVIIIIFSIGIIQLLNYIAKYSRVNTSEGSQTTQSNAVINSKQELVSNKSAVSGTTVSETKLEKDTNIIKSFVEYCSEGNIEAAYGLLTSNCKEVMFPKVEDFYNIYYVNIFGNGEVTYVVENWTKDIYQIKFTENILSTGKINNAKTKQDYITVVEEEEGEKININNYIGRKTLNKTKEYKDIKITATEVDTYMDYEIYNLYIENNSDNTILLDTSDDTESIYLEDRNEMKYYFYNNEIIQDSLILQKNFKRKIQIKFSNSYSSSRSIENIVFSKIVLNYDEYIQNKEGYNDFVRLKVDI